MIAPNFRHGQSCCNCDHGILINGNRIAGYESPVVKCDLYGIIPIPGGVCDDWEED